MVVMVVGVMMIPVQTRREESMGEKAMVVMVIRCLAARVRFSSMALRGTRTITEFSSFAETGLWRDGGRGVPRRDWRGRTRRCWRKYRRVRRGRRPCITKFVPCGVHNLEVERHAIRTHLYHKGDRQKAEYSVTKKITDTQEPRDFVQDRKVLCAKSAPR